mmetsp:Transcript_18521/g.50238  ORF Transcript_18521/g.50238 Transcript_18521/m.50238 type:complete len:93 (-) Transcript_18521:48-326(-)
MSSFLDKVARIRTELIGAPSDMPATQVVAAALQLMDIVPEPSWALPQMVDAIIVKMTGGGGSTSQAPATAMGIFLASLEPNPCPYSYSVVFL